MEPLAGLALKGDGWGALSTIHESDGMITYCRVYLPASMLAWGSELRFSRRITILAFDLGSESSASDCCAASYSTCRSQKRYLR